MISMRVEFLKPMKKHRQRFLNMRHLLIDTRCLMWSKGWSINNHVDLCLIITKLNLLWPRTGALMHLSTHRMPTVNLTKKYKFLTPNNCQTHLKCIGKIDPLKDLMMVLPRKILGISHNFLIRARQNMIWLQPMKKSKIRTFQILSIKSTNMR
jgi:hypothetical protein